MTSTGSESGVEFRLLGSVRAAVHGRPVVLGTRQRRFVLAMLLLEVNRPVQVPRLTDLIWPDDPPACSRAVIQSHISRLKKALGGARAAEHGVSLTREGSGYMLSCDPMRIDAHRFRTMLDHARNSIADEQRVAILNEALGLWQGPALASVTSEDTRTRLCQGLEDARLTALEDRIEAELRLMRHHALVDELFALTAEHPTRQCLIGQLMLALHRSQRKEDATKVYHQAKLRLAEETGLDLTEELTELHDAILRDDPRLRCPSKTIGSSPAELPSVAPPRQLPPDTNGFTGRERYLRQLDELVADADDHALVIATIEGTAGVGKTALAVRWAHQMAERYLDGQLFIDLRSYGPGPAMSGTEALAQVLRALGVATDSIPVHENERSALYRSLLADKRVLVVLDNAAELQQVRPLLPGSASCLVLITSRDRLGGLVAMQGAHRLTLDVLAPDESTALLARFLGRRAAQDPPAITALAAHLAHLPLALRIAVANLLNHPQQSVAEYTAELRDLNRLDALVVAGDEEAAVRVAFDHSQRRLDEDTRRLFRLLGLHPGADIDPCAAAAIAGTTLDAVRRGLDTLASAHLVQETSTSRYQMHDLLRVYAAEQAHVNDPEPARCAALTRVLDFYLRAAHTAMDWVYPNRRPIPLNGAAPAIEHQRLTNREQAMTWLDSERANLVAATRLAASEGWPVHAWQLPNVLYRFFYLRGHIDDWIATHRLALTATRQVGDHSAEAETLNNLGTGYLFSGRYPEAHDYYQQALTVCRKNSDHTMQATALSNLALLCLRSGHYADARDHFRQALALHRQGGDQPGEARTLNNLGLLHLWMGQPAEAIDHCQHAATLARQIGYPRNEAAALDNLGAAYMRSGDSAAAVDYGQRALTIFREIGDRRGEAAALNNLGTAYTVMGHHTRGLRHHDEALTISRELHIAGLTCEVLNHTGTSHRLAGLHQAALDYHGEALALAHKTGERHEEARAHEGIARTQADLGDHEQSIPHWRRAAILYTELAVPEAIEARSHVDELTS